MAAINSDRPQGKRPANDELDGDQRLTKRFNLMHLDGHNGKLYIPVANGEMNPESRGKRSAQSHADSEYMQIEDTKNRVFIHDLDEELADLESDDEHPVFIPDIEKHLTKIPHAILVGDDDRKKLESMQLVLYNVPSSLSVPHNKDSVRRAILESRQRSRNNQGLIIPEWPGEPSDIADPKTSPAPLPRRFFSSSSHDEDAMDIS